MLKQQKPISVSQKIQTSDPIPSTPSKNTKILNQNITFGINRILPGQNAGIQAPQDDYFENESDQKLANLNPYNSR